MAPDNFHLFPGLPLEIQDRIWQLCLPRRVIKPHYTDDPPEYFKWRSWKRKDLPVRSWAPFCSPLISCVCKRARATAMRCGQFTPVLVDDEFGVDPDPPHFNAWLNKTDLVFFNFDVLVFGLDNAKIEDGDAAPKVFELARDFGRPLLIDSVLGEAFNLGNGDRETTEPRFYNRFLRGREQVYYVMVQVYLYVSWEDWVTVVKTGLFGLFGEDIAIVPTTDKKKLQQYISLYDTYDAKHPYYDGIPHYLDGLIKGKKKSMSEPRRVIRKLIEGLCKEKGANNVSAKEIMNEDDSLKSDHPLVKQFGITMPTFEKVVVFELRGVHSAR